MNARLGQVGGVVVVGLALFVDLLVWLGGGEPIGADNMSVIPVVAVTGGVYATLLLRWRHPLPVFLLQWAYAVIALLVLDCAFIVGLLVALHAVAARMDRRPATVALIACSVPFGLDCYVGAANRINRDTSLLASFAAQFVLYSALTITVWGLGRLSYAAERRSERLARQRVEESVRAERMRVARELHDIVSHAVSAMLLQAAGARSLVGTDDARVGESLDLIQDAGVQAMTELHRLLGLLRAANAAENPEGEGRSPRLADVAELVATARASGVDVELVVDGTPGDLDASVELAAFRIVQEALTNTIKHAGRGAAAEVNLNWGPETLTITIRDSAGSGPLRVRAGHTAGYGLMGLAERVNLVGGRLATGPVSGGFQVLAELPRPATDRTLAASLRGES